MTPQQQPIDVVFERTVETVPGSARFNPYVDVCNVHDRPDAPAVRRRNLRLYLDAQAHRGPLDLWLAEAPGFRGSRRTGVPLVPEPRLASGAAALGTAQPFEQATRTPPQHIRTAEFVWAEIERIGSVPLLWNAIPHHPHRPHDPLTNRTPARGEVETFAPVLVALDRAFEVRHVIAIGRIAQRAAGAVWDDVVGVRHPAQGGAALFRSAMRSLYPDDT